MEPYNNMKWDDAAFEQYVLKFLPEKDRAEALRRCRDAAAKGYSSFGLWDHVEPNGDWVADVDDIAAVNPVTGYAELLGADGPISVSEGVLDREELIKSLNKSLEQLRADQVERFPGDPVFKAFQEGKSAAKSGKSARENIYCKEGELTDEEEEMMIAWDRGHSVATEEKELILKAYFPLPSDQGD